MNADHIAANIVHIGCKRILRLTAYLWRLEGVIRVEENVELEDTSLVWGIALENK